MNDVIVTQVMRNAGCGEVPLQRCDVRHNKPNQPGKEITTETHSGQPSSNSKLESFINYLFKNWAWRGFQGIWKM